MNKIFKIIWSKARNCYVVVSELAKSHDDGHVRRSRSGCCRKAAVLAAFVLTTSLAAVPVWAADSNRNVTNDKTENMTGSNTVNNGTDNIVYGSGNTLDNTNNAVVVGKGNKGNTNSVVIGNGAQSNATDQIVIGKGKANGDAIGSIVIGNSEAIANTSQSVIIGNSTKANGSGQGVIVIGNGAMADDSAAGYTDNGTYIPAGIVLGEYSYSNTRAGKDGFLSNKKGDKPSPAFTDEYWNAVWKATANPMAIGNADTDANGKGEGHNGHGVLTRQITGVAAGTDLTDAVNVAQLQAAMAQFSSGGSGTGGDGVHFYSVKETDSSKGNYNNEGATGTDALAAGVDAKATGNYATAVGNNAQALKDNAVAIGNGAVANGTGATVIGQYGTATGSYALAFGGQQTDTTATPANNVASGDNSVAFGERTTASGSNSTAFGQGTKATEKRATAFGQQTQATQSNATAFGINTIASGQNATAFGNLTQATAIGATAFGNKNQATGQYATAWGGGDKVVDNGDGTTTKVGTVASGTYATAFGERTVASGESATAFGSDSTASGKNSLAFGENSTAAGDNSLAALGGQVTTSATNAAAIGKNAQATLADSVALGSNSVTTRAKYSDLTDEEKKAVYIKGDSTGSAWEATDNAIAVGNDSEVTRQITGVAAGSLDTDAVNVAQLKKMAAEGLDFQGNNDVTVHRDLGQKLTIQGEGKKADTNYSGENLKVIGNTDGSLTIKMDKDIKGNSVTVGEKGEPGTPGKDGVDGTIGVNGKDGSAVVINGKDGSIGLNGKDGANGLTIKGDKGKPGVDGADGITRIVYEDKSQTKREVATLDDGLKFHGDSGDIVTRKLNTQLDVLGGQTDTTKLTDGNIGVVSTKAADENSNGKLEIRLAKELKGLTSVQAGDTTIDGNGLKIEKAGKDSKGDIIINKNTVSIAGNQITNMGSGLGNTYTAAGDNNGANIGDVKQIADGRRTTVKSTDGTVSVVDKNADKPNATSHDYDLSVDTSKVAESVTLKYKGDNNTEGSNKLSEAVTFSGTANQIVTKAENGKVTFGLADDVTTQTITANGKNGNDGQIGLTGKNGADGSVTTIIKTVGAKGTDGKDGIPGVDGQPGKDGITRLIYQDGKDGEEGTTTHTVATLDDGLKFHGDSGDIVTRKLNTQLDVLGGQTDTTKLTDGNIGVVSTKAADENSNGKLEIRLAKELKGLTSVQAGDTTIDGNGLKIEKAGKDSKGDIIINKNTVSIAGNQITNMGSGLGNTYTAAGDNNGANIGDVKQIADGRRTTVKSTDGTVSVVDKNADKPNATSHDYDLSVDTSKVAKAVDLKYKGDNNTEGSNKLSEAVTFSGTANQIVTKAENGKVTFKLADDVTTQTITAVGQDGKDGQIGLTGKNGADGKVTTIIKTVGAKGTDGKDGIPGVDGQPGKDGITRLIYQDGKDGEEGTTTHTVATLDDGLKFHGDSGDIVTRKLNTQLDVLGGQTDTTKLTDGNIGVVSTKAADENSNGKLEIRLAKELKNLTSVQTGDTTVNDDGLTINKAGNGGKDSITINKTTVSLAGNQITNMGSGLGNTYTAAGDNNGANIGDVKQIADGRRTTVKSTDGTVSVVDKNADKPNATSHDYDLSVDTSKVAKAVDLKYKGDNNTEGSNKLSEAVTFSGTANQIVTKAENGKVTFGLADDVTTQTITAVGQDGKDGQIGLTGKDGADGKVTTIIKTVGAKGTDGKDGIPGVDGQPGKDGITRLTYDETDDKGGTEHHVVATLDDGLKFVGNDGKVVTRKLNDTLSIKGGIDDAEMLADAQRVSSRNLGVRQNTAKDGLEIVMTNRPDFEAITVGPDGDDPAHKITIGQQDNKEGNPNPTKGNYITGLDNTQWDAGNVVADRAATEGQLSQAITDISGKDKGGFGLADEKGGTVKKNLGETIAVKGDGKNIETTVKDGALEVSLKKDVDLGQNGSIKAGNTIINSDGVETNKVKVGDITITDQGINGGAKQITNIASGIDGKQYKDAGDNNAASIGDVKKIAGEEAGKAADAVKSKSGKNITVKDDHTVNLNDDITLGDEMDASKQVSIDGNNAKVTAGDGANKVTVDGSQGRVTIGTGDKTMTMGKQANTAGDSNPAEGNYLNGLDNTQWDGEHIQNGRAATEDQLKTVSDKVNRGRVFQGDDGQNVTVGMGDTLKIQGGAKNVSSDNNIGIVKGADDTLNIRLAKDIKGLDSVTTGNTTINNSGLTVKGDDNHKDITIHHDNVNMGGNTISGVADGKVSKDSTDAVNGSQLWQRDQAINGLSGSVNKLGNRINRVGAGAAALAALHPLDFDPDDKWDFAAGYGNYRGANAAAIGAYYRPNEDTMFSVGGSFGGGENMVNAGVSIKLGQGNHVSTSRVAMAKEMKAMRQHMAEQDALIAKLQSMHGMAVDPAKSVLFPDVAENHWAYQYVTTLAKKGILEGYPDGEFKGDRMMTRYEFAAIVYRIVESGVGSTDPELSKLVKEFSPELQYIRIDTIQKDRNGKPTIERVRVISDAK